jgi:hypothetical protein
MNLPTPILATAASSLLQVAGLQVTARKPRSDAILYRLLPEQRAKVDRWLLDKNLTYAQVAEGCQKMFGVKISKSSVGRYFERRSLECMGSTRLRRVVSGVPPETVGLPPADPSANAEAGSLDPAYQLLLQRLTETALREAHKSLDNLDPKWLCRLLRLLIASRQEKNFAARVRLERDIFEIGAAKACLKHWRSARGSVSRSQPRMSHDPRSSYASAVAKLLRVTDPRSVAVCPPASQAMENSGCQLKIGAAPPLNQNQNVGGASYTSPKSPFVSPDNSRDSRSSPLPKAASPQTLNLESEQLNQHDGRMTNAERISPA